MNRRRCVWPLLLALGLSGAVASCADDGGGTVALADGGGEEDTAVQDAGADVAEDVAQDGALSDAGADAPTSEDVAVDVEVAVDADAGPDTPQDVGGDVAEDVAPDGSVVEDDAVIVGETLPSMLACGETFDGAVTVRNTGSATWTRAGGYKLGVVDDSDPFLGGGDPRVWLADADQIGLAQEVTFRFTLVAPDAPGRYTTDWRMVHEGVRWFGETVSREVVVACDRPVDATTLEGKVMAGYQGWFAAAGDGSPVGHWVHWARGGQVPGPDNMTVDLWPELSEYGADELFPTDLVYGGGAGAPLYSAWTEATVVRHVEWAADYGLDGLFLQRFTSELGDPRFLAFRDQVARHVRRGSEEHGRVFAIMYDLSGQSGGTLVEDVEADWRHLVDELSVTGSDRYLHHLGKPLVAIWGLGFEGRDQTPAQAHALLDWFTRDAEPRYQATVMGGVPTHWRTLTNDSATDPGWADVYRRFAVISPWTVGRYADDAGVARFRRDLVAPDMAEASAAGRAYLPVVFPGFSWHNLNQGPLNQIPRRGGAFFWKQVYEFRQAGATMLYLAMFDEVDEGTALYKLAPTAAGAPTNAPFVTLDADQQALPADWYLRLSGAAAEVVHGARPLTAQLPIVP